MNYKKWLHKALLSLLCLSTLCASGCSLSGSVPVALPEYEDVEIDLLGYVNPTNGDYEFDRIPMNTGTDYRTVERFKEYKDAGLNIAFSRYDSALPVSVTKDTWEESDTKLFCDKAYEAGLDKILISDEYLTGLVLWDEGKLIGEGVGFRYASEAEMDADITKRLDIYKDTPGFYGVIMLDEPRWYVLENYGVVYRSLMRVMPEMYLYNNLHYCHHTESSKSIYLDVEKWTLENGREPTIEEAYTHYLDTFFMNTGAKNLAIDIYPFEDQASERLPIYFSNAQILKKMCDKYGAEMSFTGQSICYISNGEFTGRVMNKNDLWLQMNTMLGFGATSFQYYTYFPYPSYTSSGTSIGSFIDRNGERTSVYYDAKSVNEGVRKFDQVLLHYDFQGAKFYLNTVIQNAPATSYLGTSALPFNNTWEHTLLKKLTLKNDVLLTTELKDEANDLYMYMIMNPIDSLYAQTGEMRYTECSFTAEFPGYDYVAEFNCGDLRYVKLDNGKYTNSLSSGYAVYLVPLKIK